jgi:hypothetical protein
LIPRIHRQAGFAEKNTKDAKSQSVHSRLNPSVLKFPTANEHE